MYTCKIIIKDEVNCRLDGLPVEIRRKLVNRFRYVDPAAKYTPAVQLGRWDGSITFFGIGGDGFIAHLPIIIDILIDNKVEVTEVIDQRKPIDIKFNPVTEEFWGDICWPKGHQHAGKPIRVREDQVEALNLFAQNPQSIQCLSTGYGKCQPLYSKVLTPSGFITMGDINVGDNVVTPGGQLAKVINTYSPGTKDVYEFTFMDGRKARACEDHIWKIFNNDWHDSKQGVWQHLTTKEIISLLPTANSGLHIPLIKFQNDVDDIELPLDPWFLGILIGNGSINHNMITLSLDDEIISKFTSLLDCDSHCTNIFEKYANIISDLGLSDTPNYEKEIPEIYFSSSFNQRLELVKGLMDSDGIIHNNQISFSTISPLLAEHVKQLIWSIGGIADVSTNGVDEYTVCIKYYAPLDLFSSKSKKDQLGHKYNHTDSLNLKISKVEKVSTEVVKCIMIDHPDHLYVTDNYIVTHNTIVCATMVKMCEQYGRTLTIVPSKSLVEQTEEDYINCGLDVGVYYGNRKDINKTHTICTWQSLNVLMKNSKNIDEQSESMTLTKFLKDINTVIVDECHTTKAAALKTLLTKYLNNAPIRWGLTGTVPKEEFNAQSLYTSIGPIVNTVRASELQEKGILSTCHIHIQQLIDVQKFKNYQEELKFLVTTKPRIKYIADMISKIAESGNTLILVDRIETGKLLQEELKDTVFVNGSIKTNDRKEEYDAFKTEDSKILIATYGVAAVGINIVSLYNLVLIEPGKSFVRVIQSIGRGLRKGFDKDHVDIWDISSTCKYSKRHLTERKSFYKESNYKFTIKKFDWDT
jgi:hypothetical protein